jgi:hypothetical protein
MATWKELTKVDGNRITVNMDRAAYVQRISDSTEIVFAAGAGDKDSVRVTQSPDEICYQIPPITAYMKG